MTPRTDLVFIDLDDTLEQNLIKIADVEASAEPAMES